MYIHIREPTKNKSHKTECKILQTDLNEHAVICVFNKINVLLFTIKLICLNS